MNIYVECPAKTTQLGKNAPISPGLITVAKVIEHRERHSTQGREPREWVGPELGPVSEALLQSISARQLTAHALARQIGISSDPIRRFIRREASISLDTADKLAKVCGLLLIRPAEGTWDAPSERPISGSLRSAIAESGLSTLELTRVSGVRNYSLCRFVAGESSLILESADKLAASLRLRTASLVRARELGGTTRPEFRPEPLSATLREAMVNSRFSSNVMAKKSGLHSYAIRRFVAGESSLNLESADKLAAIFGIRVAIGVGDNTLELSARDARLQPLSAGMRVIIRAAIAGGRSVRSLVKESGVHHRSISAFISHEQSICLRNADKLATVLGARTVRPEPEARDDHSPRNISAGLRSAIAESGLDVLTLANLSGLRIPMIRRFIAGRQDIKYSSAARLADAVGYELGLARPRPHFEMSSSPTERPAGSHDRRCPVELRGEAFPIRVYGRDLPPISGVAYTMLTKLVDAFRQGGGCRPSDLSALADSGRLRALARALDRPGFEPLRRVIPHYKGGKGRVIEIVDVGPRN